MRDRTDQTIGVWLSAKLVSDTSAFVITIVLGTYAFALTQDPLTLSYVLALKLAGSVAGAVLSTRASRRMPKKSVMIGADVLSGLSIGLFALTPERLDLYLIFPVVFLLGVGQGLFHVAMFAAIPNMRGSRHRINALVGGLGGISVVLGGIGASYAYELLSTKQIFLVDALTFFAAALVLFAVRGALDSPGVDVPSRTRAARTPSGYLSTSLVRSLKGVGAASAFVVAARFVEAFGSSTHNVGFPILSTRFDEGNPAYLFGWIMALWGVGKMASVLFVPRAMSYLERKRRSSLITFFHVNLSLTFVAFLCVFGLPGFYAMVSFAFIAGVFDASTETAYYSILQAHPEPERTALIGVSYAIERFGMGSGILLVGLSFSSIGVSASAALFYLGSVVICTCFMILGRRSSGSRDVPVS